MQVRRRSDDMGDVGVIPIKNAVSKRQNSDTQARPIKNAKTDPHPQTREAVKNAVNKTSKG